MLKFLERNSSAKDTVSQYNDTRRGKDTDDGYKSRGSGELDCFRWTRAAVGLCAFVFPGLCVEGGDVSRLELGSEDSVVSLSLCWLIGLLFWLAHFKEIYISIPRVHCWLPISCSLIIIDDSAHIRNLFEESQSCKTNWFPSSLFNHHL